MRVKGVILSLILASMIAILHSPVSALAQSIQGSTTIVISEISMGTSASASNEFVELYNNAKTDIDVSNWTIYYKSSTGKTWTKKASLPQNTIIHSHDYLLIASELSGADVKLSSGLAQTGGTVQLRDTNGTNIDMVGWGTADTSELQAATAAQADEVVYRQFDDQTQTMIDSDNNFSDFDISSTATPKLPPAIEIPAPDITTTYPVISLSELLPDPVAPQSDTSDEFIELYNPNNTEVNLSGWILKDAGGASYILKDKTIPSLGYLTITSAESSLSLNNSGDSIYLYSPDNNLVDESADYGNAKPGLSWAVVGNSWSWTVSPTPNAANSTVYVETITSKPANTTKTTTAKKAAVAKKAATSKVAKAKAKPSSTSSTKSNQDNPNTQTSTSSNSLIWSWLLIALGVGTIGYGIYEYRPEIIAAYHRLVTKFGASK